MSSASAAEGTPEIKKTFGGHPEHGSGKHPTGEKVSAPFRETKLCCVFVKFPVRFWSSVLNMKVVLDDLGSMPNYEHTLEQWGFPG